MKLRKQWKSFGGWQKQFEHDSQTLGCEMRFSVFVPSLAESQKVPVLYWLSGLTCTDENFVHKAGAQKYAERHGLIIVAPDTSPRGEGVPDDEDGAYDFGLGAGFYLNATEEPWSEHYKMYDYVIDEMPKLIEREFAVDPSRQGIFGHSMGGHGALVLGLRNPERFRSISAFSPVCAPMQCPWGQKAFSNYLGSDREKWRAYDATELVKAGAEKRTLFIDQGLADEFLDEQLHPHLLEQACRDHDHPINLRRHEGYDHSYFFIASFVGDHITFHAKALRTPATGLPSA